MKELIEAGKDLAGLSHLSSEDAYMMLVWIDSALKQLQDQQAENNRLKVAISKQEDPVDFCQWISEEITGKPLSIEDAASMFDEYLKIEEKEL